jgi:hypothetical protein
MAFVTPTDVATGEVLTASRYNQDVVENTIELRATHADAIRRVMANTNTFTNQTGYADFPNATDKAAMDITFVKDLSGTSLLVAVMAQCSLDSGAAQNIFVGLSIGGTDYDVGQSRFTAGPSRNLIIGTRVITGVNAGSLAVKPRFKTGAASSVNFFPPDDFVTYSVTEIRP